MIENVAHSKAAISVYQEEERPVAEDRFSREAVLRLGCLVVALLVPLKLSLTYIALIPLILLWAWTEGRHLRLRNLSVTERRIIAPVVFFLSSVALSAALGINPLRSLKLILSLFFFATTMVVFSKHGRLLPVLIALLTGQTIAALHSVLDAAFPNSIPGLFIGKVSESGQLALTILISLGLLWHLHPQVSGLLQKGHQKLIMLGGFISTAALIALGFRESLQMPMFALLSILLCTGAVIFAGCRKAWKETSVSGLYATILTLQAPLLIVALMVNLKRGPWLGVVVGATTFFVIFAPRLAALVLSIATVCAVAIAPITERLAASYQHFTIVGGRSTIWRIGAELIAQFPLGIGFHNSDTLRRFAPEIPPELRHFHNNILNITAENGWLTCAIFAWFVFAVVRQSFARPLNAIHAAIGCAIISWQTAGMVEYNVGDSEVMLVVWLVVGALLYDLTKGKRLEHTDAP